MRKLYSLVLMATALLIGTNAKAVNVTDYAGIQAAIAAAVPGTPTTIVLENSISDAATIQVKEGKQIEIDLNGFNITQTTTGYMLEINNGSLKLTNSQDHDGVFSGSGWIARMTGSNDDVANYSVLNIGAGVSLTTTNGYGIVLYQGPAINGNTSPYGYGLVLNIDGYVRSEGTTIWVMGNIKTITGNAPIININETAEIVAGSSSAGIYNGGYSVTTVKGTISGGMGVYVKAGNVTLDGAEIHATGAYKEPTAYGNGYYSTGDAIMYDSHSGYTQDGMSLTITGETSVTSDNGYAIKEVATKGEDKQPDFIVESGTFQGAEDKGAIITTDAEKNKLQTEGTISGGTFVGDANITDYLGIIEGTVVAVTDEKGNTSYVVENINPSVKSTDLEAAGADNKVVLNSAAENVVTISSDKEVAYLALAGKDKVVVTNGATLRVGNVAIGEEGQIEVMAGSKLVVFGENGVVSNHASNLLLHTEEGNPSYFLLNPAVTANKHPLATVEFISKSFTKSGDNWSKQRFGIPTFGALQSITTKYEGADVQTAIAKYDFSVGDWTDVSWINIDGKEENLDQFANPFEYYQMQHNTPEMGTVVTMVGRLVGNEIPQMNVIAHSWNGYANSLMGTMNIDQVLSIIPNSVQKAIYLNVLNAQNKPEWDARTALNEDTYTDIAPMQAFMIRNELAAAAFNVDYEAAVYNPTIAKAPARYRAANNWTKVQILVSGEEYTDNVIVAEGEEFTADFDNGYEAVKYMNDGINMYVSADEKMAHFATNDLNNTFVGLQTINGGNYTIEFANVQGEELTLIDHETGARVAMVEGATYEFTANGTNDYRFEIVGRANMPTAIDNTEAVKSAKGVYTITGQYVGEMNVWNTLPAGVYVVNGEKRVK